MKNPLGGGRNVACDRKGVCPKGDVARQREYFETRITLHFIAASGGCNTRAFKAELPLRKVILCVNSPGHQSF